MPLGPCDHICQTGTEEQCSSCILTQYATANEAIEKARELGKISDAQALILIAQYKAGARLFRYFLDSLCTKW